MLPISIDFHCRTNADYVEELQIIDHHSPIDLTSKTLRMMVRKFPGGSLLFELNIVAIGQQGLTILNAVNGQLNLKINRTTLKTAYQSLMTNLTNGQKMICSHDLSMTHSDGLHEVIAAGKIQIEHGVTYDN